MASNDIDDIDAPVDDDEAVPEDDLDDLEPSAEDLADDAAPPPPPPEQGLGEVESIQEILAKQETAEAEATAEEVEEDVAAAVAATTKIDERLEPTDAARVVPMQATEFMCKRCFLVKHRSQLADKKKMLCRDCA